MKIVRNPAMARLKGTSGNSKGEHFFDLLSDRPWVRIPPGLPFCLPDLTDLPPKGSSEAGGIFVLRNVIKREKSANRGSTPLADFQFFCLISNQPSLTTIKCFHHSLQQHFCRPGKHLVFFPNHHDSCFQRRIEGAETEIRGLGGVDDLI